ncbi:hypothetical protein [Ornithinibacillus scapharcae]|uniref:hypothetical protein n=1 Tax=Ornithinibacillus scapharcae TaxID=1147159 RepID=UPI000225B602|nr:hypothetical protein [Ornithinibacillus scapharcae]
MTYTLQVLRFIFSVDDHIFRIGKAETVRNPWKVIVLLSLLTLVIYGGMGMLGMGSTLISSGAVLLDPAEYEMRKLWFVIGRVAFALTFALFVLFIPTLIFYWVTKISFKKLLLMQVVVLFILLMERVLWIPMAVFFGLDWFVSPFSFGVIASYFTDISLLIYLFGAVSLFQLWIIALQIKYLIKLSTIHKGWIYATVILLHLTIWTVTAIVSFTDIYMIDRWFA